MQHRYQTRAAAQVDVPLAVLLDKRLERSRVLAVHAGCTVSRKAETLRSAPVTGTNACAGAAGACSRAARCWAASVLCCEQSMPSTLAPWSDATCWDRYPLPLPTSTTCDTPVRASSAPMRPLSTATSWLFFSDMSDCDACKTGQRRAKRRTAIERASLDVLVGLRIGSDLGHHVVQHRAHQRSQCRRARRNRRHAAARTQALRLRVRQMPQRFPPVILPQDHTYSSSCCDSGCASQRRQAQPAAGPRLPRRQSQPGSGPARLAPARPPSTAARAARQRRPAP